MNRPIARRCARARKSATAILAVMALVVGSSPEMLFAQTANAPAPAAQNQPAAPPQTPPATAPDATQDQPTAKPHSSDRRKAAKLYLDAAKLFVDSQFEQAEQDFEQAAKLDPTNSNYRMAAEVARSHAVTALVQEAAKDRLTGNEAAAMRQWKVGPVWCL
jgi:TolA-binding protein